MPTLRLPLTPAEADKLLDLIGHDSGQADVATVPLVRVLHRALSGEMVAHITDDQLLIIHRAFVRTAFGEGAKEFRVKMAQAFREWDTAEDVGSVEATAADVDDAPTRARLQEWRERDRQEPVDTTLD